MDAVAVIFRKHLGEVGLQVLGRLLRVDGLLAARVGIDAREDIGQSDVVALGEHRNLGQRAHLGRGRGIHPAAVDQRLDDHAAHRLRHVFIKPGLSRNRKNLSQFHSL